MEKDLQNCLHGVEFFFRFSFCCDFKLLSCLKAFLKASAKKKFKKISHGKVLEDQAEIRLPSFGIESEEAYISKPGFIQRFVSIISFLKHFFSILMVIRENIFLSGSYAIDKFGYMEVLNKVSTGYAQKTLQKGGGYES